MAARGDSLTPHEVHEIQSVCGAAMWLSTQTHFQTSTQTFSSTQTDLAFATSELIGKVAHDKNGECLSLANKLVKKINHGKANGSVYKPLEGELAPLSLRSFPTHLGPICLV